MTRRLALTAFFGAGFLMTSTWVLAHHGAGPYDLNRSIDVSGRITQFDFVNPHVEVYFEATDDKGSPRKWVAESGSPNMLHRLGWSKDSLKPGDQVILNGNPSKDGSPTIRLLKITFPDGRELKPGSVYD
jgi:hypothetical protein